MDITAKRKLINKTEWMAAWSLSNAIQLHFDSILLFKQRSYSSSLALSILSMEEIAKAHVLETVAYNVNANNWDSEISWKFVNHYFYSHRRKQLSFANHLYPFHHRVKKDGSLKPNRFVEMAQSGELELLKQNSIYVGFTRNTFLNSRLRIPNKTPRTKPLKIITLVNDYLIDLTVGQLIGAYGIDSEYIIGMLTKRFIRQLKQTWSYHGRIGKNALRKFRKQNTG